jgi:hypothetical protein
LRAPNFLLIVAVLGALCVGVLKEAYDAVRISRARQAGLVVEHSVEFSDTLATLWGGCLFVGPIVLVRSLLAWGPA